MTVSSTHCPTEHYVSRFPGQLLSYYSQCPDSSWTQEATSDAHIQNLVETLMPSLATAIRTGTEGARRRSLVALADSSSANPHHHAVGTSAPRSSATPLTLLMDSPKLNIFITTDGTFPRRLLPHIPTAAMPGQTL